MLLSLIKGHSCLNTIVCIIANSPVSPLPCLYDDCLCTFHSVNALQIHLTRLHTQTVVQSDNQVGCVSFVCAVCKFKQPFNDKTFLRTHLKHHEMVDCPFKNCHYHTNVYSSFNAHKSRTHLECEVSDFKTEIVLTETDRQPIQSQVESDEAGPSKNFLELDAPECHPPESGYDIGELQAQLRNNLASLFLKMQCSACIRDGDTRQICHKYSHCPNPL